MNKYQAILQLMHTKGIGAKTLNRLLRRLISEKYPIEDFVQASSKDMLLYKIKEESALAIKDNFEKASILLDELESHSIRIISIGDKLYPDKLLNELKESAPPVLFVRGNIDIFEKKAVGFCGSRDASEEGIKLTSKIVKTLAANDINIISGYAHGIDLAAHQSSLLADGFTTFVLPIGILNFQLKNNLRDLLDEQNHLIISEFIPKLGWHVQNAMQRNNTIISLSNAMILVESKSKGGTFEAGKITLKYGLPLFVVDYEFKKENISGNQYFLKQGAIPLQHNKDGAPNLSKLYEVIDNKSLRFSQTSLFEL